MAGSAVRTPVALSEPRGEGAGPRFVGGISGGGSNHYVAQATGPNFISSSTGSFLPIVGGSSANSESGYLPLTGEPFVPCTGPDCVNNIFSLQMYSQSPVNSSDGSLFFTPACSTAPNGPAGCSGWQQFVFSQTQGPAPGPSQQSVPVAPGTTPGIFIEYWMYGYGSPCPTLPSADSVLLPSTSLDKLQTVKRCFCDAEREGNY